MAKRSCPQPGAVPHTCPKATRVVGNQYLTPVAGRAAAHTSRGHRPRVGACFRTDSRAWRARCAPDDVWSGAAKFPGFHRTSRATRRHSRHGRCVQPRDEGRPAGRQILQTRHPSSPATSHYPPTNGIRGHAATRAGGKNAMENASEAFLAARASTAGRGVRGRTRSLADTSAAAAYVRAGVVRRGVLNTEPSHHQSHPGRLCRSHTLASALLYTSTLDQRHWYKPAGVTVSPEKTTHFFFQFFDWNCINVRSNIADQWSSTLFVTSYVHDDDDDDGDYDDYGYDNII